MHIPAELLKKCWILAGPTAVGKSAVGLELAGLLGAEIVVLDSMTVYRGMDIGTAKPSAADQARVPHHLLDVIEPHEEFSLAEYLRAASVACGQIIGRGKVPLFVGGTGLYLRSVLRGLFEGPEADWELRRRLEAEEQEHGTGTLHTRLQGVDPASAGWLHPNDLRRIIRALEVWELTGVPLSVQQQQAMLPAEQRPRHVYWLEPDRAWLHSRIDLRVEAMITQGLVEEVRNLLARSDGLSRTARQALGYVEVIQHLEEGVPLTETIAAIQTHTRQFAKRQHTWFRNLPECRAIQIGGTESATEIAGRLYAEGLEIRGLTAPTRRDRMGES